MNELCSNIHTIFYISTTLTLSRKTVQVDEALIPSLSSFFPRLKPSVSLSTTNIVIPLYPCTEMRGGPGKLYQCEWIQHVNSYWNIVSLIFWWIPYHSIQLLFTIVTEFLDQILYTPIPCWSHKWHCVLSLFPMTFTRRYRTDLIKINVSHHQKYTSMLSIGDPGFLSIQDPIFSLFLGTCF